MGEFVGISINIEQVKSIISEYVGISINIEHPYMPYDMPMPMPTTHII